MRMRVCYLYCHEAGLCCYLVIHIGNLSLPLQLFYFNLWRIYWRSLVVTTELWGVKWSPATCSACSCVCCTVGEPGTVTPRQDETIPLVSRRIESWQFSHSLTCQSLHHCVRPPSDVLPDSWLVEGRRSTAACAKFGSEWDIGLHRC
jgi:hypothetical protein